MDNTIFDKISPYISLGMLTVFIVFLALGMLFGMGRGVKRASIRLVILVSLLVVAFLVTPLISRALLGTNMSVMGRTPAQSVDEVSDALVEYLQEQFGDYVKSFESYIKDYAVGIVLAIINLALFFVLYFIVKIFSWSIYAVVARFAAPKRDSEGNKLKRYRGLGLLVGALQGVLLFTIFMFPINGVVAMINNTAVYAAQQENEQSSTQTAAVRGSGEESSESNNQIDINELMEKYNAPLKTYNKFIKYSGIEFLSEKALEYQLTVRVDNGDKINLVHDINSGLELAVDAKAFGNAIQKFQNAYQNGKLDLTELTENDYRVMRQFLNKAFDLQILNVAKTVLGDMDKILSARYDENETMLAGTDIYEHSIYGLIIKNVTTEREFTYNDLAEGETAPTNYAQFAKGLRAVVNRVADRNLDLVRADLINMIDLVESLNVYQIKYTGMSNASTVTKLLAANNNGMQGYFDLSTAKLVVARDGYAVNTPIINVIGDRLSKFEFVQLITLNNFENLLIYNKVMDNAFASDADMKKLVDELIPMFLGQKALTHEEDGVKVQGNWERLGSVLLDVAGVLRDYVNIMDKLDENKAELIADAEAKGKTMDDTTAQARAILKYMADLAISKDYFEAHADEFDATEYSDAVKYQKIDKLVDALYRVVNEFEPIKTFMISKLEGMKTGEEGDYIQMLIDMLDKEKTEWQSTLRNIVNMADIINNSALGNLIEEFQNLGDGENITDLTDKLVDAITELEADDVADMLTNLLDMPEVNNAVQDNLTQILNQASNDEDSLKEMFGEENYDKVQNDINTLKQTISDMNNSSLTEEQQAAAKENLQGDVSELWKTVQKYLINNTNEGEGE